MRPEPEAGERTQESSLIVSAAHVLRRGYERVCSAIFDNDTDCMQL